MLRRYSFKLYPNREQHEEMLRQCHMVGDLWNALLERCETNYRLWREGRRVGGVKDWPEKGQAIAARLWCEGGAAKSHLSRFDLSSEWSWLRAECPEWRDLSTWTGHRVCEALDGAFQAFFRRMKELSNPAVYEQRAAAFIERHGRKPTRYELAGYPKFRPRRLQNWLPHRAASGFAMRQITRDDVVRQLDWAVTLKGVPGVVRAKGRVPGKPLALKHADIRLIDGTWWLSIAVEMPARRKAGTLDRTVRLDLLGSFATVDGFDVPAWMIGEHGIRDRYGEQIADLQRRMAEVKKFGDEWRDFRRQVAKLQAKGARQRKEALHEWTTEIVRSSTSLTVVRPPSVKEATVSGKGGERNHGAAVQTKADFNRHVLGQAPSMAIQMLAYKAAEAGIEYREVAAPEIIAEGEAVVRATKAAKKAARAGKRKAA